MALALYLSTDHVLILLLFLKKYNKKMDLSRLGSQLNFRSVSVGLSCPDLFCRLTVKSENQFAWSNSKENTFYQEVISTRIIGAWLNTPHRSIKAFPYFFCHCSQYHQQTKPKPKPKKMPTFFQTRKVQRT